MRGAIVMVFAAALGCGGKKDSGGGGGTQSVGAPASTADQDALWALAPEGAQIGIVVSARANAMIDHGLEDIRALLAAAPEMAAAKAVLETGLTQLLGKPDAKLADTGLTSSKGGAFFITPGGGGIAVVPVGDRDKLLAVAHGTKGNDEDKLGDALCRTIKTFYICASDEGQFAKVGKGALRPGLDAVGTRGDIEVVTTVPAPGGPIKVAGVLQLARGMFVARAAISGMPPISTALLAGAQGKPPGQPSSTAGFAFVDVRQALAQVPPLPIVEGVTAADIARSIAGPLSLHITPGANAIDFRIPLSDPKPYQAVIDQCDRLPISMGSAHSDKGTCRVTVQGLSFDAWIENTELRVGSRTPGQPTNVAMGPIGEELLATPSAFVFWGRGTALSPTFQMPKAPAMPAEVLIAMRALSMLNEFGLSVRVDGDTVRVVLVARTAWANPDDVVAKLVAIGPQAILDNTAGAAGQAVATGAPSSPFAADFRSGPTGLVAPMAVIGILAAVAVPAFMDYMKKSKRTEADLQLNKLGKEAKMYFNENAAFPVADAPLTPAQSCCEQGGKCAPAGTGWMNAAWTALDFQIDEPTLYQYRYHSDGKTLDAEAIGDLDCDGTAITYHLHVEAPNGNPTTRIEAPMPGSD